MRREGRSAWAVVYLQRYRASLASAGDRPVEQPFKRYSVGYFHIGTAEVRTEEGKPHLFVPRLPGASQRLHRDLTSQAIRALDVAVLFEQVLNSRIDVWRK